MSWTLTYNLCTLFLKPTFPNMFLYNVCFIKKDTKHTSNALLRLVSFFKEQTLFCKPNK